MINLIHWFLTLKKEFIWFNYNFNIKFENGTYLRINYRKNDLKSLNLKKINLKKDISM
jgi:hypothetical protein